MRSAIRHRLGMGAAKPFQACLLALSLSALVPASPALADGAAVDVATSDQKLAAQKHFETAIKAFGEDKFDAALAEFTASYGVVASPNAHYMMAKCLNQLGKPAEAYNALASIEKEARGLDKYGETLKNSADLRAETAKKVGLVVVNVGNAPAGAVSATVGQKVVPVGTEYAVMPGRVDVAALVDGKVVKNDGASIAAGESHTFKLDLAPAPVEKPRPLTPQPIPSATSEPVSTSGSGRTGLFVGGGVAAGVAVAGFAVGIPYGLMYRSDKDTFTNTLCHGGTKCDATQDKLNTLGHTIQREGAIATAGFVVGGVAAAASITLFAVGATRSKGAASDQSSIEVEVGPGSLGVAGKF